MVKEPKIPGVYHDPAKERRIDHAMKAKGYRYKLICTAEPAGPEPLYAKTQMQIGRLLRDWPKYSFRCKDL